MSSSRWTLAETKHHLLAMLVRDFGYDHEPLYGWTPMRHQLAWSMATQDMQPEAVKLFVEEQKVDAAADGEPFEDYFERRPKS